MTPTANGPGRPIPFALAVMALSGLAVLVGLLLGADAWQYAAGLMAMIAAPLVLVFGMNGIEDSSGKLFLGAWALMLISTAFHAHGLPVGYLLEAVLGLFAIAACRQTLRLATHDKSLRPAIALFCLFMAVGFLSTVLGRSRNLAAVWQVLYSIKLPLMFMAGTLVVWTDCTKQNFAFIIRWSWTLMLLFVVIEIAAPGVHAVIFGPRPDWHGNPILGIGLRYRGLTAHPGYLAIFSALLGAAAVVMWLTERRHMSWAFVAFAYVVLMLLSGQRQETLAYIISVSIVFLILNRRHWPVIICVFALLGGAAAVWLGFADKVPHLSVLDQWGFGDALATLSERGVLYRGGIDIASRYFPLGSGFGTYGGVGAQKYDVSLMIDLGFERHWWFRQRMFLVDTYWPGILAETGLFGVLFLAGFFTWILLTLIRRGITTKGLPSNPIVLCGVCAMTLMMANSPSSILLTDPRGACLFWLLIGAGWRASVSLNTAKTLPL